MKTQIEILLGEATDSHAHLVVRATCDGLQVTGLTGSLTGPQCRYARTLPTCYPLRPLEPLGTATGPLAELMIPDPCFWTPELPLVYRLDVRLQGSVDSSLEVSQLVGIRRWGVDRTAFRLEGRRTVLRGLDVGPGCLTPQKLSAARDRQLTLVVHQVDDTECEEVSLAGVALVADLRGVEDRIVLHDALVRASRWPAVLVVLVRESQIASDQTLTAGLPVLQLLDTTAGTVAPWADGVLVEIDDSHQLPDALAEIDKPVLAFHRGQADVNLATARQACDRLQAELAPRFDLAGYFVGKSF